MKWIKDENGNRCSTEWFRSEKAARRALKSLKRCKDCVNCENCSDCVGCVGCQDCSHCFWCFECMNCQRCNSCCRSSDCDDCSGLSAQGRTLFKNLNVSIPKIENIHIRIYAAASRPNALAMTTWHDCDDSHCRAGWVITLAGEEGQKLERQFGTGLAAFMIYRASSKILVNPVQFYTKNKAALSDMRRLADLESVSR